MPLVFSIITSSYNQLDNLKKIWPHIRHQSFRHMGEYEWIIADDGSTDGTVEWCKENNIKFYHKEQNTGYGLVNALNEAAKLAEGQYLVWIMGDSFPKFDFLEQLYKFATPETMLNGIRYNVDWENGDEVIAPEWRITQNPEVPWWTHNAIRIGAENGGYVMMTLNSMCMPRALWEQMGGIPTDFDGYGKMDWYMACWMYYSGYDLTLTPRAVLYHRNHEDREDTPQSGITFDKYLNEFMMRGRKKLVLEPV